MSHQGPEWMNPLDIDPRLSVSCFQTVLTQMSLRLHANKSKNLLTWYQAIALDFHFAVEQRARGFLRTFYGQWSLPLK